MKEQKGSHKSLGTTETSPKCLYTIWFKLYFICIYADTRPTVNQVLQYTTHHVNKTKTIQSAPERTFYYVTSGENRV